MYVLKLFIFLCFYVYGIFFGKLLFNHIRILEFREFSNERNRVERRMEFQKCRFRAMFQTAMVSYLDWITQAGLYKLDLESKCKTK